MYKDEWLRRFGGDRKAISLGSHIAKPATQRQHHVRGFQRFQMCRRNVVAQMAGVVGMTVGEEVLLLPAHGNRQLIRIAHLHKEFDVLFSERGTNQHDRALRLIDELRRLRDIFRAGRGDGFRCNRRGWTGCLIEQHILRQRYQHRTGNAGGCACNRQSTDGG